MGGSLSLEGAREDRVKKNNARTVGALGAVEALLGAVGVEALDAGQRRRPAAAAAALRLTHVHEADARSARSQPVLQATRIVHPLRAMRVHSKNERREVELKGAFFSAVARGQASVPCPTGAIIYAQMFMV